MGIFYHSEFGKIFVVECGEKTVKTSNYHVKIGKSYLNRASINIAVDSSLTR